MTLKLCAHTFEISSFISLRSNIAYYHEYLLSNVIINFHLNLELILSFPLKVSEMLVNSTHIIKKYYLFYLWNLLTGWPAFHCITNRPSLEHIWHSRVAGSVQKCFRDTHKAVTGPGSSQDPKQPSMLFEPLTYSYKYHYSTPTRLKVCLQSINEQI